MKKPNRNQLCGLSPSQFKTLLKRIGYKVSRDLFKHEPIAYKNGRAYRLRYWNPAGFFVDVSCELKDFDRWTNSTFRTVKIHPFKDNISSRMFFQGFFTGFPSAIRALKFMDKVEQ